METHYYEINVKWNSERKGTASSPSLQDLEVATPPEFPKGHSGIWSPEHLFVASSSVCLMTTFLAIAENSRLNFTSYSCKATGKLEQIDKKFMISEIVLEPTIVIPEEKDKDKAHKIIEKSEAACLISNSMKTKVILKPDIQIGI
ncbi:MAG: OsmC family protein [Leptospiraceae bacterium]|nr:OsmC family protein [Leptospiraceae bacterium]